MRGRHSITVLPESIQPDVPIRPEGSGPSLRCEGSELGDDTTWLDAGDDLELVDLDEPYVIDESVPERPFLPPELSDSEAPVRSQRRPAQRIAPQPPGVRPSLPWGAGTNGWPRYRSRLVRLFACDPDVLIAGVAERSWGPLVLGRARETGAQGGGVPMCAASGTLQMPYVSPPLLVELQVQPFHGRYARVDVVMLSPRRRPRRFFDVASQCLTSMQRLERPT